MNPSGIICLRHEEHGLAGDGLEGVLEQVVQPALQVVHMHGPPLLDLGHHHLREEGDQERAVSTRGREQPAGVGARRGGGAGAAHCALDVVEVDVPLEAELLESTLHSRQRPFSASRSLRSTPWQVVVEFVGETRFPDRGGSQNAGRP